MKYEEKLLDEELDKNTADQMFTLFDECKHEFHLLLKEKNLEDKHIPYVCEYLKLNPVIHFLSLDQNKIGPAGAKFLAQHNTTIKSLSLGCNQIGDEGCDALIKYHKFLTSLEVNSNDIGDHGVSSIPLNTTLKRLKIPYNRITNKGAVHLSRSVLDTLFLRHNHIGALGAYALEDNQSLTLAEISFQKPWNANVDSDHASDAQESKILYLDRRNPLLKEKYRTELPKLLLDYFQFLPLVLVTIILEYEKNNDDLPTYYLSIPTEMQELLRPSIDTDTNALFDLAVRYSKGQGVTKDPKKAAELYEKVADHPHREAQFEIAECYKEGKGVDKNLMYAIRWYREAADWGHLEAQFKLGTCYDKGYGVEKNKIKACHWYKKAAEQNYISAQFNLAIHYVKGSGVDKNLSSAAFWFLKAAQSGHGDSQYNLATHYKTGLGVEKDEKAAAYWYRLAAINGHKDAQYNLAVCYSKGAGVAKNEQNALHWYWVAAEHGHSEAQFQVGLCYSHGQGVEQNWEKAIHRYQQAAEWGHTKAQVELGVCYENGHGVKKDKEKASEWYKKAATAGCEQAIELFSKLSLSNGSDRTSSNFQSFINELSHNFKTNSKSIDHKPTKSLSK